MTADDWHQLLSYLPADARQERHYARNAVIFQQGGPCQGLWQVHSGQVDLQRVTESGHRVLIHRALAGQVFAEASLFSPRYHCTALAARDSVVSEIGRAPLLDAIETQPQFAARLCAILASQVQQYRRQVEILSIRKAADRVYEAALDGLLGDDLKGFAARIGLTHEAVYRSLASLTRQGRMIKVARGCYRVARVDGVAQPSLTPTAESLQ